MDAQDISESRINHPTAAELQEKIATLRSCKQRYEDLLQQLEDSGTSQISLTDPDSRSMKTRQGTDVCDNLQGAVDHQHKLMVEHDVTNDVTDQNQLAAMATCAKATLDCDQ